MTWFAYICLLAGLSWAAVGMYRWYAIDKGMLDHPGKRSSHTTPTPRGGGFVFFLLWFGVLGVFFYNDWVSLDCVRLFVPVLLVGLIGFREDTKGLSAGARFLIQILCVCACLFVMIENGQMLYAWMPSIVPLWAAFGLLVFAMVWMINLFNFMDGSDGIAASQGFFIFTVGGYLLFQHQAAELGILAWSISALLSGFLIWNWPTAKIFMGDCGSYFLGFLTAVYAVVSVKFYHVPLYVWVLLTMPFWFDATVTLIRRICAGHPWREPHRLHAYQRLIQADWSHQSVLLSTICINLVIGGLVIASHRDPRLVNFSICASLALVAICYLLVEYAKPMLKSWHPHHNDIPAPPLPEDLDQPVSQ